MTRVCAFVLMAVAAALAGVKDASIELKVGVTEYQNTGRAYVKYRRFFHDVELASGSHLRFLIAVGTYDEVLKWRDEGKIDVAVLSATPVARMLAVGNNADREELQNTYLGHVVYFNSPIDRSTGKSKAWMLDLFPPDQRKPKLDGYFQTICVVRKDSPFESLEQIVAAANRNDGSVKFLFVRPYSMSGYIHPRAVLNAALLQKNKDSPAGILDAEFTRQHDNSLKKLLQPGDAGKKLVAFVLDQTSIDNEQVENLRRIPIAALEQTKIPEEAVFVSSQLPPDRSKRVRTLLTEALSRLHPGGTQSCDANQGHICFDTQPTASEWLRSYDDVVREMRSLSLPPNGEARADLSDLFSELAIDQESSVPTRLALVLSGGGAKCAYQVGAIKAIVKQFQALQQQNKERQSKAATPKIDLVVGTSGGAINALFYALGAEDKLEGIWTSFDQQDLIQPGLFTRLLWGLCTGVACVLIVFFLSVLVRRQAWWHSTRVGLVLLLAAILFAAQLTFKTAHNHWLFHGVFLLRLSLISSCAVLVVAVALTWSRRLKKTIHTRLRPAVPVVLLLAVCFGLLLFDVLWMNDALTDLSGAKQTFVTKLPGLLHDQSVGQKLQATDANDINKKLAILSNAILAPPGDHEEFRQDLILTASRLRANNTAIHDSCNITGNSLPNDLYFYYDVKADRPDAAKLPSNGDKRFISLRQNPNKLFDVVLGSSTIYPVFRAQKLDCLDVTRPDAHGRSQAQSDQNPKIGVIDIVDGGFSHNSPLDAAISWGATHVLLIQASPAPVYQPPSTFASHAGNAFNYLFDQAQGTDYRARGQVKIFELAPSFSCDDWFDPACTDTRQQWLDLVDFSKPLLQDAIKHGYYDVTGPEPMFTRIPGPPIFIPATPRNAPTAEEASQTASVLKSHLVR